MTKPTNEEIAALERWHAALADAERELRWLHGAGGTGLITTVRALRRKIDDLLGSIGEGAGQ